MLHWSPVITRPNTYRPPDAKDHKTDELMDINSNNGHATLSTWSDMSFFDPMDMMYKASTHVGLKSLSLEVSFLEPTTMGTNYGTRHLSHTYRLWTLLPGVQKVCAVLYWRLTPKLSSTFQSQFRNLSISICPRLEEISSKYCTKTNVEETVEPPLTQKASTLQAQVVNTVKSTIKEESRAEYFSSNNDFRIAMFITVQ